MKAWIFLFSVLLFTSFCAIAQDKPSPEAEVLFTKMMSQINSRHVQWIQRTAKETNDLQLDSNAVMRKAKEYTRLGKMNGGDIEALAFLVLMQASKSAQEDLKAIMAKVKSINEQKAKLRSAQATLKDKNTAISRVQLDSFHLLLKERATSGQTTGIARTKQPVTKAEISDLDSKLKANQDSLSELGEIQSLKMQMAMDRMTKMMSTISNILKKIKSTQDSIIQNLK
ncbi:MAG TPA: hypothetical protein PKC72_13065 [Chitinophagaceae bacterium]|mgnify:CR=1 FL=1|nr:hypothetical protein [Chitinophagaceae bacterium]